MYVPALFRIETTIFEQSTLVIEIKSIDQYLNTVSIRLGQFSGSQIEHGESVSQQLTLVDSTICL